MKIKQFFFVIVKLRMLQLMKFFYNFLKERKAIQVVKDC